MVTKIVSNELILESVTQFLSALSMLDDNQVVTKLKKVPEGWEIHTLKDKS
jgi:hypothetical protein